MRCGKCGNEILVESRFCPSCGAPLSSCSPEASRQVLPKKKLEIWAILAGLCVVAAVGLVFALSGGREPVTRMKPLPGPQHAPLVNAPVVPSAEQPGILHTDVQKPSLDLQKQVPPPDVVQYLQHLQQVERARQEMTDRELSELVSKAPDLIAKAFQFDEEVEGSSGAEELAGKASRYSREWQQISSYFLSVQPPQACSALAQKYYDSLREVIAFMGGFQDAVLKMDLTRLKEIRREQVSVDQKLTAADQELAAVCNQFGIEKTFSIRSDTGQTPLLGF